MYDSLISRLLSLSRFRTKKVDLSVPLAFSKFFAYPERNFPSVHVAGTNGKGSVATKIAKACELSRLKVGLFTSPHLFFFEERIKVSGIPISKEKMAEGLLKIFALADKEKLQPTFFEIATILAFEYFREQKIDIAVIEVGLGGRFDATNVIHPLLSVITSISREHVQILGESLEEIAFQKAGIIKPGVPVVIGPGADFVAIKEYAQKRRSPLYQVQGSYPFYDDENKAVAKKALQILSKQVPLSLNAIEEGVKCRPLCRFEKKEGMIFDVAHNPHGFMRLQDALKMHYPHKGFRYVIGMSPTKEIDVCLKVIAEKATAFHFVQSKDDLTISVKELENSLKKIGNIPYFLEKTVSDGIQHARSAAKEDEIIVVCGSFYIIPESYSQNLALSTALSLETIL